MIAVGHELAHVIHDHCGDQMEMRRNLAILNLIFLALDPTGGWLGLGTVGTIHDP